MAIISSFIILLICNVNRNFPKFWTNLYQIFNNVWSIITSEWIIVFMTRKNQIKFNHQAF